MRRFILGFVAVMLWLAPVAGATDGVLEINQACAENTGCFSGDGVGFPVEIDGSAGRSYRLTSDLVIPDAHTTAIMVQTNSISIDLNGFEIATLACVNTIADCTPITGAGYGVTVNALSRYGTAIRNGTITGMGSGVYLGPQSEITNLRVRWNNGAGIEVSNGATITGNTVYDNDGKGIWAGNGSTVSGNTLSNNLWGIHGGFAVTVTGNTVYNSDVNGIWVSYGSVISGNTSSYNGQQGIATGNGSTVEGNAIYSNGTYGLSLGEATAYVGNVITGNATADVLGVGVELGPNLCGADTDCPEPGP